MFYCMEVEGPLPTRGAAAIIGVAGIGETALAAQDDAVAYLNRIAQDMGDEGGDWDYWEDAAGDSGFMLLTLELAQAPQEWEVKACDTERANKAKQG